MTSAVACWRVRGEENEGDVFTAFMEYCCLPECLPSVSVLLKPARLDVNAPETSNAHSCPVWSSATKLSSMPRSDNFTSERMFTNPQEFKRMPASSFACRPSRTARA